MWACYEIATGCVIRIISDRHANLYLNRVIIRHRSKFTEQSDDVSDTTDPNLAALTLVCDFEVMSVRDDDLGTNTARSRDRGLRNRKRK